MNQEQPIAYKDVVPRIRKVAEYSVEIIQMVAACMASDMKIEQVAELQLAYPTFTEAVGMAAQKLVRELGLASLPTGCATSCPYQMKWL
jgi:hypothetical protein